MPDQIQVETPIYVPEIIASHRFDAPADLVFDAFSSHSQLAQWWGPTGFSLTTRDMTFAPQGVWRFVMHGPDGRDYENKIVFDEIERPHRLSFVHPGDEETEPVTMKVLVKLEQSGHETLLDWRAVFPSIAERDRVDRDYNAAKGLAETLSRLDAHVRAVNERAFAISRLFEAPQSSLWRALTEPDQLSNWWGPKGFPVAAAKMDFRPGGRYLYGLKALDGGIMWGRFVYRNIDELSRIVLISSFSNEDGEITRHPLSESWPLEMLSVFQLESKGNRTRLTVRATAINATDAERETLARAHDSLMQGWSGTLGQLEDFIATNMVT